MLIKLKSGEGFECENSLILYGAIAAGFPIPFSCKRGECDTCECTLLEGTVDEHGEIKTAGEHLSHLCGTRIQSIVKYFHFHTVSILVL